MSLCDRCFDPGRCCRDLHLIGPGFPAAERPDPEKVEAALLKQVGLHAERDQVFPFRLSGFRDEVNSAGASYGARYACEALGDDGRCTVYARRPDLCRRFEPGEDDLCVHSRGFTAEDASAGELPRHYGKPSAAAVVDNEEPWP